MNSKVEDILNMLPDGKGCVVVLSGGMDSTIAMRFAVEKYGSSNVYAISFDYGQKQRIELKRAAESTALLGVQHLVLDAGFLNKIATGFSANVDPNIAMPTIKEVLGDPAPKTEVPFRNMILLSIASGYAQTKDVDYIICGLQIHDQYGYWDTTLQFVESMNLVIQQNRVFKPKIIAPFSRLSKKDEIDLLRELDGRLDLLEHTMTCYNPNSNDESCGQCPSCSERIAAFKKLNLSDPLLYSRGIEWKVR